MAIQYDLTVKCYRKKWFIYAGVSRLSQGFKTEQLAEDELKEARSFYEYWAGSCSFNVQNTTPKVKNI